MKMQVSKLRPTEVVDLDADRLVEICAVLGPTEGEDAICAAMEDLAELIYQAEHDWGQGSFSNLAASAEQIIGLSERIGMPALMRAAQAVQDLCDNPNPPALAATVARLRRLGEKSLIAVWDVQDQMV